MSFYNGPTIVTNGLVLCLDAGDRNSYVSGSTTWRDLSGNGNNGTLVNGPLYDDKNSGGIRFLDDVNDYISLPTINTNSNFTLDFWTQRFNDDDPTLFSGITNGHLQIRTYGGGIQLVRSFIEAIGIFSNSATSRNTSLNITITRSGTTFDCYINSGYRSSLTYSTAFTTTSPVIGINTSNTSPYIGIINVFSYYNRTLTAIEIRQNFNAQKSRFGL